jgi:hypothetical protein
MSQQTAAGRSYVTFAVLVVFVHVSVLRNLATELTFKRV